MTGTGSIAVIANRAGLDSQARLARVVDDWRKAGAAVVGVLAEDSAEGVCSAGFLRDIVSGMRYSIQLDTPPAGTACHLDAAGLGDASPGLLAQIAAAPAEAQAR